MDTFQRIGRTSPYLSGQRELQPRQSGLSAAGSVSLLWVAGQEALLVRGSEAERPGSDERGACIGVYVSHMEAAGAALAKLRRMASPLQLPLKSWVRQERHDCAGGGEEGGVEIALTLWERSPLGRCMVAGSYHWADAGSVSSSTVEHVVEETGAAKKAETVGRSTSVRCLGCRTT